MPFLLLILFGIIVYGMVFAQSLSLSNAARQAARSGVVQGTTCAQIGTLSHDAAGTMGMDGSAASVSIMRGTSAGQRNVLAVVAAQAPSRARPSRSGRTST